MGAEAPLKPSAKPSEQIQLLGFLAGIQLLFDIHICFIEWLPMNKWITFQPSHLPFCELPIANDEAHLELIFVKLPI